MRKRLLYGGERSLSMSIRPRQHMSQRLAFYVAGYLVLAFTFGMFIYFQFNNERGYATSKEDLKKSSPLTPVIFNAQIVSFSAKIEKPAGPNIDSATTNEGVIKLVWKTSSESNNDFFTIERSTDGFDFIPILKVDGSESSFDTRSYSAYDAEPVEGRRYYRLKQTYYDGRFNYSKVITVKNQHKQVE